ncbi:porin [Paraferrimonas sedimenticola]|uniref:Porin n=1 Tax=Paraferrimonas sedimenticola TaxID=375674 RepID=A0AA37RXX8_9GAMM|nr:porin [Paraferrimonas sedimenticola]GLP96929.1 porin [Paraferrimonas sedimenticola]
MKLAWLSSAVSVALAAPAAQAIEVFNDGKNSVGIGGYADVRVLNTQGKTEVADGTSRINFDFNRNMGRGWDLQAKMEWGVNLVGNTDISLTGDYVHTRSGDFLNNRLGFVKVGHEKYGSISAGKQWGVYYDVVAATDIPHIWAGTSSGVYTFNGDGGLNGTGRADKALQYRNEWGNFKLGLQVQARNSADEVRDLQEVPAPLPSTGNVYRIQSITYNSTYGASARYQATDKLEVGVAYNQGEFEGRFLDGTPLNATDKIAAFGSSYGGMYDEGLYLAFNVNQAEFHEVDNEGRIIPKSTGAEALVSYALDGGWVPFLMMNYLKADEESYKRDYEGDTFERSFITGGVHYQWDKNTILYIEGRKDFSKVPDAQKKVEDDGIGIGIRVFL